MPYKIVARSREQKWEMTSRFPGLTLLEELQQAEVPIKSSCLGKGLCHQCRVRVEKGFAATAPADRKTFSDEQLRAGWRLSCCLRPKANIELSFPQVFVFQDRLHMERQPIGPWWMACDLGTTGVEIAAVDAQGAWAVIKSLNRQVSMGADVMTRLEYAQRNGVKPLYERIAQQLHSLVRQLTRAAGAQPTTGQLWVAGNSAVTAFLAQQPIENLAVSPYQPESCASESFALGELQVETLPLLYSFVGGDLFAGLFCLWKQNALSEPWILMDVGTNSEILFWDGQTLFVSSTPAGPAFEGSSISIGMRAEDGAILNPQYTGSGWKFATVNDDMAKGICGTGLVEMIAEGVRHGLISVDGEVLRPEALALNAELALNQDDVREFQLAKSAIATGLELVQGESEVKPVTLYLAGAFGEHLPQESCQQLGLLPRLTIRTLGNSSLNGTILWAQATPSEREEFEQWLKGHMHPVELALRDDFQAAFVQNMALTERRES